MNSIHNQFNTPQLILIGKENFAIWKLAMAALLQVKGLWGCIIGDPACVEDQVKDSLARTLIILSIEAFNYSHIQETKTAREAWDKLESAFGDSGLIRKMTLLRGLVPTQLIHFTYLQDYVNSIITSSLNLRDMGFEVTEEWIGLQLLAGLTDEYWPLIVEVDDNGVTVDGDTIKPILFNYAKQNNLINKIYKEPGQNGNQDQMESTSAITPLNMFEDPQHCIGAIYGNSAQYVNEHLKIDSKLWIASPDMLENAYPDKSAYDNTSEWITKNVNDWYNNYSDSTDVSNNSQQEQSNGGNSSASALSPSSSIKKDDLEVEVRGEHGGYHEAFVTDVFDNHVEVKFDYDLQTNTKFAFADVRFPPKNVLKPELQKGEEIEVYTRANEDTPWGWWKAVIDKNMGNGYAIVEIPRWLGSKFGHGECVPLDRVRVLNDNSPIDHRTFYKREISVPEEQRESAKQENVHKDFQRAIGAAICRYVPERGVLLLISRNENLNRLSSWLDEMHFGNAPEAPCFLRQLRMSNAAEPLFSNYL